MTFVERFREASALMDFYTAPVVKDTELRLCPDEVAAAVWVSLDEVQFKLRAGMMALPWRARLEKLWPHSSTHSGRNFPLTKHTSPRGRDHLAGLRRTIHAVAVTGMHIHLR